jgi:tetratricopeptide (TPR) repeat protein
VRIHPHDLLLLELATAGLETRTKCLAHLAECSECQVRLRALQRVPPVSLNKKVLSFGRRGVPPISYEPGLERVSRSSHPLEEAYARERAEAPSLYKALTQHPIERWPLLVRNCPRFQTWGFCELLLHRSREQNFHEPVLGESIALLTVEILDHLDESAYGSKPLDDLRARAWSCVANSRRIQWDLQGAEEAFGFAFSFLRLGTGDLLEKAMLLDLKASLLSRQNRFSQALGLLRRSLAIFLDIGETHRAGRALVRMSSAHVYMGEPEMAISLLYRALDLIDPSREPRLLLVAWHNLINDLSETGQFMEAQKLLVRARPLYKKFAQSWSRNPHIWLEGQVVRGLGQQDRAEALFLEARDGFLLADAAYDTALVSLDLASLYVEQGRMAELRQLAEQMVPIFSSRQIHREALAALDYWRQAVTAERAGASLIARIGAFLVQARHNPELRFQTPPD